MKIVSMVPSWTETLLECGANVVGRTRFCIHPETDIRLIPSVGGTKDIRWDKVESLAPDLLLLDREENPKSFSDEAKCRTHATHVTSVDDVPGELEALASVLREAASGALVADRLHALAERWKKVALASVASPKRELRWDELPGLMEWVNRPSGDLSPNDASFVYVIWKSPWMAAAHGTFIASVWEKLGWPMKNFGPPDVESKYPEFALESLTPSTVLLCSSEPFPFHKKKHELEELPFTCALVDGESFSWFGSRSLRFLERNLLA